MVDFENDVGPIRQIPGTQNTRDPPPGIDAEPEWMKLSTVMGLKAGGVIFTESQYRGHVADMKNEYESNWPLDMHVNVALYNSVFAEPEYCMMQKNTGEGLAFNSSVLSYGGIHYMPKNYITLLKNTKPTQQN